MVKKVKTFLNNAEVIEDENRLLDIANQCEPGKTCSKFVEVPQRSRVDWMCPWSAMSTSFLVFHFFEHTNQKISEFGELSLARLVSRMLTLLFDSVCRCAHVHKFISIDFAIF
jgi:hypothetical protein